MRWFEPPEGADLLLRRYTNRAIIVLALAFLVLGLVYSFANPLFEAPDEVWHYPFVKHLADGKGLPVLDPQAPELWNQEGGQPPLYYAIAALITRWVPSDDLRELLRQNPHLDTPNKLVHDQREQFPYRGAALAVHMARGVSVVLGAVTVFFAYALGLEALPRRPAVALAAAGIVAFTPTFVFISAAVSNDNLVVALATVALWYMVRLVRLEPRPWRWAVLGGLIGLAALTKISGLALLAPAGLTLVWMAWRRRDWRVILWGGAWVGAAVVAIAGWWYYRNWRLYHDPFGWSAFLAIIGRRPAPATLAQLAHEVPLFVRSYWGAFGWADIVAPPWFYRILYAVAALGAAGLVLVAVQALRARRLISPDTLFRLGLVGVWPVVVLVGLVRWTMLTWASYGRLLFPAIAALSLMLAIGLAAWCRKRWVDLPVLLAPALMAALAAWVPFGVIAPTYAWPPLLTETDLARVPHRLDLSLGGQMELVGYDTASTQIRPGDTLSVTLYWRALEPMPHNYSVFVHLLGEDDIILAQRDQYPGRGLFPTTFWRPGDAIADTYLIRVPPTALNPTRAQLEVGLYRVETGERLLVRDRAGRELGDNVRFGDILVRAEPRDGVPNPLDYRFGKGIALVGYALDRTALPAGDTLHLTLYWKCLAPVGKNYTVFTHVLGPGDAIWAQKDAWPMGGAAPTGSWRVGQVVEDRYDLVVRPETPEGVYDLEIGLYLAETGERLPVVGPGGGPPDSRVLLNRVRVVRQ